jgi:hypothetical protein
MKSQTPSTKLQINLKFQYQMTKTGLEFGILVIVICLLFEICDLEILVTSADCRNSGKTIEAPSEGNPKPGPSPNSGIFDGPGFFT